MTDRLIHVYIIPSDPGKLIECVGASDSTKLSTVTAMLNTKVLNCQSLVLTFISCTRSGTYYVAKQRMFEQHNY